eukprot:TRINITY_DN13501_c0_g1_i3.p1 TRINITY_DN13501_c0_g1~~TRINITY_DN13501_c0_g1_i3.p1  ORF type:complete len:648 (-),score=53.63 TRINITY_DN13501_c0_g1_i3:664-2607(-)
MSRLGLNNPRITCNSYWQIVIVVLLIIVVPSYSAYFKGSDQFRQRKLLEVVSFDCSVELSNFLETCALQNQPVSSKYEENNTLSACCWDANCCTKMNRLVEETGCIDACVSDTETLELISMYSQMCPGAQVDFNPQDCKPKQQNQDVCDILNDRLVSTCGTTQHLNYSLTVEQKQYAGACCWNDTCCDQATMYISMGCMSQCHSSLHHQKYAKGNVLAKFWAGACNLPISKLSQCEAIQWIENWSSQSTQQFALKSSLTQPFKSTQEKNDELPASEPNNTSALHSNQMVYRNAQNLTVQGITSSQQQQNINSDSYVGNDTIEIQQNDNCLGNGSYYLYGPQYLWNQTAFSFCSQHVAQTLEETASEFGMCCTVIQELVEGACNFRRCFNNKQLPAEYNATTGSLASSWQNKCKFPVDDSNNILCNSNIINSSNTNANTVRNYRAASQNSTTSQYLESSIVSQQLQDQKSTYSQVIQWDVPFEVAKYAFGIYPVIKLIPMLSTFTKLIERFNVLEKYHIQHNQGKMNFFAPTNSAYESLSKQLGIPFDSLFEQLGDLILNKMLLQHMLITKNEATIMAILTQGGGFTSVNTQNIDFQKIFDQNKFQIQVSSCCNQAFIIYGVEFEDSFLWVLDSVIQTVELAALILNR